MDYEKYLSPVANGLKPSGIRRFFDIAAEMDHVISLGVGEPDFKTPWAIRQEAVRTLEKGQTWYTANAGLLPLRQEIARYLKNAVGVEYHPKDEIWCRWGEAKPSTCASGLWCSRGTKC